MTELERFDLELRRGAHGTIDVRQSTFWDMTIMPDGKSRRLRVHLRRKREARFAESRFEGGGMYDEHPLLVNSVSDWAELFLATPAEKPRTVLAALREIVSSRCAGWRTFDEYANDQVSPEAVLEQGYGTLLKAPTPVVQAVDAVLKGFSLASTQLPFRSKQAPARLLLLGRSFLIAEEFQLEPRGSS
jgi:hypothetical protein